ncbi:MAG: DUF1269 domain-containing protein [Thioalkalispiraceae bacterium]|jgi:hypothetical protein
MRRRLYFLLPSVQSAKVVHNELLLAKIDERHQHVIARDGTDLDDLPEADIRQKSDIVHGLQLGVVIGALTGLVLAGIALMLDMIVPGIEAWSVASLTGGGAFLGAFASTMIAINIGNTRLTQFKPDIEAGRILYMVDVKFQRIEEINQLVRSHHPEADMRGVDPQIPAFP